MFDIPISHLLAGVGLLVLGALALWVLAIFCDWLGELILEWRHSTHMAVADRTWKTVDSLRAEVAHLTVQRDELAQAVQETLAHAGKLTKFKNYVHTRLDAAGVPTDPDSPHKAEGCRIGGRLDWLFAHGTPAIAERVARLESLAGFFASVIKSGEPWSDTCQKALDEAKGVPAGDLCGLAAVNSVLAERRRQQETEGWTPEHDDAHGDGSLAVAGACYALGLQQEFGDSRFNDHFRVPVLWPESWAASWWKPTPNSPRRDMVKAGALILAEIERLDRAAAKAGGA